jgi:hypothetical protein
MPNFGLSSARAEASRRNGAKSRGPKTAEGKARSAQNALKHGFRAQKYVVLPEEDAGASCRTPRGGMGSIRAHWRKAAIAARRTCRRLHTRNGESARRAEGTDVDEKKSRNEPNHGAGILAKLAWRDAEQCGLRGEVRAGGVRHRAESTNRAPRSLRSGAALWASKPKPAMIAAGSGVMASLPWLLSRPAPTV